MTKFSKITLIAIICLAFVLRFYRLNEYPALNADEAALGYNAYSLIETGKDEHGNPWPIHFQSFNDYKPGLYVYLDIPFIYVFGLNEWGVRIPGALAGVASVFVLYLLVKEFARFQLKFDNGSQFTDHHSLALLSAFFLAVSPWHIHFSRGAWEVNLANFLIITGVWLFLLALRKPKFYFLSFFSLALALYTYHAARVIAPLLGLFLLVKYWRTILPLHKEFIGAMFLTIAVLLPLLINIMGPGTISRLSGVGLTADSGPVARINEQRGEHRDINSLEAKVLHNKFINYGLAFLENWGDHFHGQFLFLSGDEIERNKVPEMGELYFYDIIFLLTGLYMVVKRPKNWSIIFLWLIITPIPAALTFQSPHALRSFMMVIPLTILSAYGCYSIIEYLRRSKILPIVKKMIFAAGLIFISWNVARYLHQYYYHMTKAYPYSSQYGIKQLVGYLKRNQADYTNIVVTDRYDQPYILFLFYLKYPPQIFQKNHQLTPPDNFGFSTVRHFDKYYFEKVDFDTAKAKYPHSLIAGTDEEVPETADIVKRIYENDFLYFKIAAN